MVEAVVVVAVIFCRFSNDTVKLLRKLISLFLMFICFAFSLLSLLLFFPFCLTFQEFYVSVEH